MSITVTHSTENSPNQSKAKIDDLVTDLNCSDQERSHEARKKLVALGQTVTHDLVQLLPLASNKLRFRIIMTLCETKDKTLVTDLIPYLYADNPTIQAIVAQFLGDFGDESVIEPLIAHLTHEQEINSLTWTIQALGKLRAKKAVSNLVQIVHNTESSSVRYTAIEALGLIGDLTIVDEIMPYLNDSNHHVSDRTKRALERLQLTN